MFEDEPESGQQAPALHRPRRRPRPLLLTILVVVALLIVFSVFTSIWTQKLWFDNVGPSYGDVYGKLISTKVVLFAVFGLVMALVVGGNLALAFRLRPMFRPRTPEQTGLDRYREVVTPMRRLLLVSTSVLIGIFAGASAAGQWRDYLLWHHAQSFGRADPYFHKDLGFFVFRLPWYHFLVDFVMVALVLGLVAAVLVHYLYGGIRLQTPGQKFTRAAQAQVCVLLGLLVLLKAVDYWLDRFDLDSADGSLITGMTWTGEHANLPSKNILMVIAVICAVLFFANVVRHSWLLPGVGIALFAVSAVLLGMIWPAIVQNFQVKPNASDKEATYIAKNIRATRLAYKIGDAHVRPYDARTELSKSELAQDAASLPGVRLIDPMIVSDTFEQLQQVRSFYSVPSVLDVDRYPINGRKRDLVLAARELNLNGLPDAQKNWVNDHTVYTHGYGMIAAYGNQRDAADQPVHNDGQPVWAEKDIPPVGQLGKYKPQIYFGENSPEYSIVGGPPGTKGVELDVPQGSGEPGESTTTKYTGKSGVPLGSFFHKVLYAAKFGDTNILLSSRVNDHSRILYDRSPRERVQKIAPWLTVDSDALPAVVDGRIKWILDGYTTTDRYPNSESRSLQEMTSDAVNPRSTFATLPGDQINYMRNAVKAVVDAYDGSVTLYAWDTSDPILKAWEDAFPGVIKPRGTIPPELKAHMRYPEDMFKVQRDILAQYHVSDPTTFFNGNDNWQIPTDPSNPGRKQPPYRLSVATRSGHDPVFSLTSVYTPKGKQNLAAFVAVGADAADPKTYGRLTILRLPGNTQVPGPSQISNQFTSADQIANRLQAFKRVGAKIEYGNLLTLPVGGGLLYVQPLYTSRESGDGSYPVLQFVMASFGKEVGIGANLSDALDDVLGGPGGAGNIGTTPPGGTGNPGTKNGTGNGNGNPGTGQGLPADAMKLLQQADQKFRAADQQLKQGHLDRYAQLIDQAQHLVEKALNSGK